MNTMTIEAWESYKESKESQLEELNTQHKIINDKLTERLSDEQFKKLMNEQQLISLDILIIENQIKQTKLTLKNCILREKKEEVASDLDSLNRI